MFFTRTPAGKRIMGAKIRSVSARINLPKEVRRTDAWIGGNRLGSASKLVSGE